MMYSLFEQKTTCPISLGRNEPDGTISEDKSRNRVTTRNRKLPVTRSKDFFMVNADLNVGDDANKTVMTNKRRKLLQS